jgi:hypothetical protein
MKKSVPRLSQEVYQNITHHLDGYFDRKSLAALARATKGLHEIAATRLWEKLHSLLPLLKLFPGEAIKVDLKGTKNL